jgi:hypothetical protein
MALVAGACHPEAVEEGPIGPVEQLQGDSPWHFANPSFSF